MHPPSHLRTWVPTTRPSSPSCSALLPSLPATPAEQRLGYDLANSWAAFAATGNPTPPGQPSWPPVLPGLQVMAIDTGNWTVTSPQSTATCPFWDSVYGSPKHSFACSAPYLQCNPAALVPCCTYGFSCLRHTRSASCAAGNATAATDEYLCVSGSADPLSGRRGRVLPSNLPLPRFHVELK